MKFVTCLALMLPLAVALPAAAQTTGPRPATSRTASPAPNPSALALYLAGNAALGDGRYDLAADYFSRAADLSSGDARDTLREVAFESAVQAGDITRAAQLAPQNTTGSQIARQLGQLVVAVDALAGSDPRKASTILSGSAIGQPFRATALMLRPWAAAAAGDKNPAIPEAPARSDALTRLFMSYNRAMLLEFGGHADLADPAYKDLIDRAPEIQEFLFSYAAFLERQGRSADALKIYDDVLKADPENIRASQGHDRAGHKRPAPPALTAKVGAAQALVSQGSAALSQNDPDGALDYFWLALRLDPRRSDALFAAASIQAGAGSTVLARANFEKIPKDAPEYVDARISIAESWLSDHATDRALATARETVSKAPRDLNAKQSLAGLLSVAGKPDEAVRVLSEVITAKGDDAGWNLYFARATAYNDMNDWKNAEADLKKALAISPDQPEVMNYLGYVWADRGERLPEALAMLQKAARAKPQEGAIIDSLGWVYYRMGDYPRAIENLEKAVELDAADPSVNDHLGDAYMGAGRGLEALYQWQRVLTLHPEDKLKASVTTKIAAEQAASNVARASEPAPVTP